MKSYTDLDQSKKLAEILPLESADMYWLNRHIDLTITKYEVFVIEKSNKHIDFFKSCAVAVDNNEIIPCWSLGSLLNILREKCNILDTSLRVNKNWNIFATKFDFIYNNAYYGGCVNLIDGCVEIIAKLKESKLL